MSRLVLFFWLLFSVTSWSQDSISLPKKGSIKFSEKDIIIDKNSQVKQPKFEANFKEKYKSNEFQYEVKLEEKSIWDRFKEWLANWFKKIFGLSDMKVSSNYVEYTLKTIAALIVCYVIYLIVKIILNKEGQWIFGKSTTKKVYSDEEIEKNLIHINFEKLLNETLVNGNHRLAIRYYYLWTLRKMSDRQIIEWNADKTNTDYLYEIKSSDLKTDFQYLSYLYNYIWYGEFEMSEDTFKHAKNAFEKTLQSIK